MDHVRGMQEPATAPWGLSISDADFNKLKTGFQSRDMDDKFSVNITEHKDSGNISSHFFRVGMQKDYYVLVLKRSDTGSSTGAKIEAIAWEQNKGGIRISVEQAKKEVVAIARSVLGLSLAICRSMMFRFFGIILGLGLGMTERILQFGQDVDLILFSLV